MAGVSQSLVFCAICGGLLFFSPPPFFIRSLYCLCFFECPSFIYHCDLQTFLAIFCIINVWENRRGNQEWTIQRYQVFAKRMQFLFCIKTLGILLILDSSSKYKQLGKKLSSCDLSGLADCNLMKKGGGEKNNSPPQIAQKTKDWETPAILKTGDEIGCSLTGTWHIIC
jgi:hypothetical protein